MADIVSQGGGREPRPWRRRAAAAAVLVLAAAVIAWYLPRQAAGHPARPSAAAVAAGLAAEPNGIIGQALPWAGGLRLPLAGERPDWFWPATGRLAPIGGLPPQASGYQFIRAAGGWAVQAGPAAGQPGCGDCAGPPRPVYFLADHAQAATWAGMADAVAPGAAAGTLWLTSYPPGADVLTAAGTAREFSPVGPPGPRFRLPAGYLIDRGTGRGLLLSPAVQRPGPMAYELWDPASQRVSRTFTGVLAADPRQIAWAAPCASRCRVQVLNLTTGRQASAPLPRSSSAANAAFSPDGKFLALQLSFSNNADDGELATQLDVMSPASGRLSTMPGTWASSDALVSFGWPASSDSLVAELSFTAKTQLASWRPGASELAIAVIRPGPSPASLAIGQYAP